MKKKPTFNICDIERILKDTNIARAQNTQKIKEKIIRSHNSSKNLCESSKRLGTAGGKGFILTI